MPWLGKSLAVRMNWDIRNRQARNALEGEICSGFACSDTLGERPDRGFVFLERNLARIPHAAERAHQGFVGLAGGL